jgi:formate dehydrogenase subunit delta
MNAERLVEMANDIANFFHSEPDRAAAVEGVRNHIRRFWEPRMRKKIVEHMREHAGSSGLSELAMAAVEKLPEYDVAA